MDDIRERFARAGLYRDDARLVAGVCAGLGRRLGLRPGTARLLFVLLLMVLPGSQVLVYPVLWLLMPVRSAASGGAYYGGGGGG
jgi:phage shock protein C